MTGQVQVIVLHKEGIPTINLVQGSEIIVVFKQAMEHLGIILNRKMSFLEQIKNTADKTAGLMFNLKKGNES